ncbi:uncharacterized protein [Primulina eburnea]|uniref:uncharacterized protein n=1 Tax=Primulina eburnea TaxID=1245227 RepID=UPI003C6C4EFF
MTRTQEEADLLERSTKKPKKTSESHQTDSDDVLMDNPMTENNQEEIREHQNIWDVENQPSYKEALKGKKNAGESTAYQYEDGLISDDDFYGEDEEEEGCPVIKLSKEEKNRLRAPWRQTLIVKVLGRSIGYNYLLRRIKTLWKPKSLIDLVALENDYFIVRFYSMDDYEHAKYEGPWMVLDHYLIVKEWSPNFDPRSDSTEKLLVWVRFPCLPIEYYDQEFLMKIGNKIGRPIRVDQATSMVSRGKFARMCVEVDITKPLLAKFKLRRRVRKIEYEGIHLICFDCGVYGHRQGECNGKEAAKNTDNAMEEVRGERRESSGDPDDHKRKALIPAEITENFGPWMMVARSSRKFDKNRKGRTEGYGKLPNNNFYENPQQNQNHTSQSMFEVLGQDINADMDLGLNEEGPDKLDIDQSLVTKLDGKGRRPNVQTNLKEDQWLAKEGGHNFNTEKQNHNLNHKKGGEKKPRGNEASCSSGGTCVWNCQGAASVEWNRALKDMIKRLNPRILGLLEPRVSGAHADDICKKMGYKNWLRVEAVGFSGGIWIFWQEEIMLEAIYTHPQFVLARVETSNSSPWNLSIVYGSPNATLRKKLWEDLMADKLNIIGPWMSIGDYNCTISDQETSYNRGSDQSRSAGMTDWMFEQGLIDLGFVGPTFTWTRGLNSTTFKGARLDRGVCNMDWRELFPEATVTHIPPIQSDHTPLLVKLRNTKTNIKKGIFRFQAAWLTHCKFKDLIHHKWEAGKTLCDNVTTMAHVLPEWNLSTFGNIHKKKKNLLARIEGIQRILCNQPRHTILKLARKLRQELDKVLEQEELLWYQKSREDWIFLGDRNTKFYHASTTIRKSRNKIEALKTDNGEWITDEEKLKSTIQNYYSTLFQSDHTCNLTSLERGVFPPLADSKSRALYAPFSSEEVKQALDDMAPFKAPGPDGIPAGFYQKMWNIVGDSLSEYALHFFESGVIPTGSNDTLLTLIPKV